MGELSSLAAKKQTGEKCVICEQTKLQGIHLFTTFICIDCEKDILNTETSSPKYKYFLKQLKKISTSENLH
ncbi:sigma factor G inhibitor Gin [Bacillus sp. 03113]|uniref:sigma factor G inhibitor Gin n=1 Tax=Bacillus sp. 03113 TaxID=2578211 RepID=UPI0037BEF61B